MKYDHLGLYSPDCSTRELQPHTSEIIPDLEKVTIITGSALKWLIMLLLLLGDLLTFWKRSSLSGYIRLLQITEFLQIEATVSTKKFEIPGAVLLNQRRGSYRKLAGQ